MLIADIHLSQMTYSVRKVDTEFSTLKNKGVCLNGVLLISTIQRHHCPLHDRSYNMTAMGFCDSMACSIMSLPARILAAIL